MATDGTYGDQITLQAVADLYNIEGLAVSTLGHNTTTLISPSASIPYARVQLGLPSSTENIIFVSKVGL